MRQPRRTEASRHSGHAVFIVKLPYRFAPLGSHKQAAVDRARNVIAAHPNVSHWVIAGHSLGGALASRVTLSDPTAFSALVLIGTTHPKHDDLSFLQLPVTRRSPNASCISRRGYNGDAADNLNGYPPDD